MSPRHLDAEHGVSRFSRAGVRSAGGSPVSASRPPACRRRSRHGMAPHGRRAAVLLRLVVPHRRGSGFRVAGGAPRAARARSSASASARWTARSPVSCVVDAQGESGRAAGREPGLPAPAPAGPGAGRRAEDRSHEVAARRRSRRMRSRTSCRFSSIFPRPITTDTRCAAGLGRRLPQRSRS